MTESEWLASADPYPMLPLVLDGGTSRKSRLFACACVRRIWHLLDDPRSREAVEAAERFADGGELQDLDRAGAEAATACTSGRHWPAYAARWLCAEQEERLILDNLNHACDEAAWPKPRPDHAHLLREVFGNPFRHAALDPALVAPVARSLAQAAYEERELPSGRLDPDRLAVLSDALEEAGCADGALLAHLRGPGPHVRGCWALDLVLGKE
ncbi:MAG: hypothetical protein K2W96_17090 [Gemmataceae bacterium]|nr:hypothetical protein [Gemmataceae bacterium]